MEQRLKIEDARPLFYKIIYGEDIKQHLRIPRAFMEHLPQELPNRATLTGPSGSHWRVTLSMDADGTYLQKGWKEFMIDNNLGDKEFLTFRYDGNMQFYVKIFYKSGVIREASPVSGNSHGKKAQDRPRKSPVGSVDLHKLKFHGCEEFQSPHFMASMTEANVEKTFVLHIPQSFSISTHLPPSKRNVVLRDSAGKSWDVIRSYSNGNHYLSGGWRSFARLNNLKPGDVCIFELVSIDEMKVHVL